MQEKSKVDLSKIDTPIIFKGDRNVAYRDPAAHYYDGVFRVFHAIMRLEEDNQCYCYIAFTESHDLIHWTKPRILTPRDQNLNFCGPSNIVRFQGKWILCFSSYPVQNNRPGGTNARVWKMESEDLVSWSEPEVIMVKGPDVPVEKMGRCIDPYLFQDKDDPKKWWCIYKQNGLHLEYPHSLAYGGDRFPPDYLLLQSGNLCYSYDLKTWTFFGKADGEENWCILIDKDEDEYVMIHAPANGVGIKRSKDLINWRDVGLYTLGQKDWPWAQGRLTAGHVLDLRDQPEVGKYLIFFHGCTKVGKVTCSAHGQASLAIAWSDDLTRWYWPE